MSRRAVLRVWTPAGPRVVGARERWGKRCACGQSYIPDEWAECDACLFKLAGLDKAPQVPGCQECDPHGISEGTYRQGDVAAGLRTLRHRLAGALEPLLRQYRLLEERGRLYPECEHAVYLRTEALAGIVASVEPRA